MADSKVMDVRQVTVRPGDRVYVETPYRLSAQQQDSVKHAVAGWAGLPTEAVLILHDQMTLRVLSKEKTDNACTSNP